MPNSVAPGVISLIQNGFVDKLSGAYDSFAAYAMILFAIVATIELVLFGLMWAMRRDEMLATFLLKIIKLGLIFLVISSYPYLMQQLINGFTQAAFTHVGTNTSAYIFNPAKLWEFGYDASISMLKLANDYGSLNVSMGIIYIILGFGLLLLFTLIGAQIVLVVAGFYIVSLLALLLIPLGAFSPVKNLFERALQGVIQIGARVFALILVIGVAVTIWSQFDIGDISATTTLDKPLGLFFSALIVWILALKIPKFAADLVGHLGGALFEDNASSSAAVSATAQTPVVVQSGGSADALASVAAGTSITPGAGQVGDAGSSTLAGATMIAPAGAASGQSSTPGASVQSTSPLMGQAKGKVAGAASISSGISNKTLNQLKSTFKQAMRENDKQRK